MTKSKRRARIGDKRWEVEWVSKLVFDEYGDMDIDRNEVSYAHFDSENEAVAYVKTVWPIAEKTIGQVEVTPIRFVPYDDDDADIYPHVGFWEHYGETLYFTDDTGEPA